MERDRAEHLSVCPSSASSLEVEGLGLNSISSKNYDKGICSSNDNDLKNIYRTPAMWAGTHLSTSHAFTDLILPTTLAGRDLQDGKTGALAQRHAISKGIVPMLQMRKLRIKELISHKIRTWN